MSKMTFTGNISFDITTVIDPSFLEEGIKDMQEAQANPDFDKLPAKVRVLNKMITEVYAKEGIEGAAREILRLEIREGLNRLLVDELHTNEPEIRITTSPCKMVFGKAQKVKDAEFNTKYEA